MASGSEMSFADKLRYPHLLVQAQNLDITPTLTSNPGEERQFHPALAKVLSAQPGSRAGGLSPMELDPTVIPIGAEIRSRDGDLIGRASEVHNLYLVIRDDSGTISELPVDAIQSIEGKRVTVDESRIESN